MVKSRMLKFICVLLIAASSSSCALAVAEKYLDDRVATHDDDQSVKNGGNQGNFK